MKVAYITHPACRKHDPGAQHPETAARLQVIEEELFKSGLINFLKTYANPPKASRSDILLAHDETYLNELEKAASQGKLMPIDSDTIFMSQTLESALHAVGAVTHGLNEIMKGNIERAFCAVRPPGHHAESNKAMGFCFLNSVAIGALRALSFPEITRVAIIDFDVHHGNGTEQIIRSHPNVLLCSSFQYPFYPDLDLNAASKNVIYIPLPAGTSSSLFRASWSRIAFPKLFEFRPQIIFISAGFDGHRLDPLADFFLDEEDFRWITTQIVQLSDTTSKGRIISTLEGGYHLPALARSAKAHIEELLPTTQS